MVGRTRSSSSGIANMNGDPISWSSIIPVFCAEAALLVNPYRIQTLSFALGVCADPVTVVVLTPVDPSEIPSPEADPIVAWLTHPELTRQMSTLVHVTFAFAVLMLSRIVHVPPSQFSPFVIGISNAH